MEAALCDGFSRFELEYMGRGPKHIHVHIIGDLLVIRLLGVLTAAEQNLVKTQPGDKGRDLLKQVRTQLIETARSALDKLVLDITEVKTRSLHHDISTVTGEEMVLFTLETAPCFRETAKKIIGSHLAWLPWSKSRGNHGFPPRLYASPGLVEKGRRPIPGPKSCLANFPTTPTLFGINFPA